MSKKHYVTILGTLENRIRPHLPRNGLPWKFGLFADATHQGTQIRYVQLRPNREGPRIGILGERFFYEASQDRSRPDALFIFWAAPIHKRKPSSIPLTYEANFKLRDTDFARGAPARKLDSIYELITGRHKEKSLSCTTSLGMKLKASASQRVRQARKKPLEEPPRRLAITGQPQATTTLKNLLGRLSPAQIEPWRPGNCDIDAELDDDTLNQLRGIWRTHRLGRHLNRLNRKTRRILEQDSIKCDVLEPAQRVAIWSAFGTKMLNRFAQFYQDEPARLGTLLDELSALAIPDDIRALVWTGRLAVLSPSDMRRELFAVAESLAELNDNGPVWEQPLLKVLERFASTHNDDSIFEVLDDARESEAPLLHIVAWARDLVLEDPAPSKTPPPSVSEPEPEPEAVNEPDTVEEASPKAPALPVETSDSAPPDPPEDDEPPAAEPPPQGHQDKLFDAWLMSLVAPDRETLRGLSQEFEACLENVRELLGELEGAEAVFDLQQQLEALRGDAERWSQTLPRREDTAGLVSEARQAFQMGLEALGDDLGEVLLVSNGSTLEAEELVDLLALLEEETLLSRLPPWLWSREGEASLTERARCLRDNQVRLCVRAVQKKAEALNSGGWSGLEALPEPTGDQDALDVIEGYIERHCSRVQLLKETSEAQRPWITLALEQGMPPEEIEVLKDRLESVNARLEDELFEHICAVVASNADVIEEQIELCIRDVNAIQDLFSSVKGIKPVQFDSFRANRASAPVNGATTKLSDPIPSLGFDHILVDNPHTRVSIVVRSYEPARPYGFIRFPLYLTSPRAQSLVMKLEVNVQTQQRRNWPGDWDDPTPNTLDIRKDQWRRHEGRFRHLTVLNIPIRKPKKPEPLAFVVTIRNAETGEVLATSERYRWQEMVQEAPDLRVVWPDRLDPEYVLTQPIGPQLNHVDIEARCQEGGSFAVLAPRRFGKSTLVAYLEGLSKKLKLIIPRPAVLTEYYDGTSLDYAAVWNHFSKELIEQLGVGIQEHHQALPSEKAFDFVRKQARKQKRKGILLLFDEAQLFFPRVGGHQLGDRLKGAIERFWANTQAPDMVPVLFGFVGLPSFQEHGGANLMGLLRPVEGHTMNEVDLNRFLREVTEGHFHTTRQARTRLARVSGNLFILRTLLNRLIDHCKRKGHHWATEQDVEEITESLRDALRLGEAKTIESYIRDIVNSAESVNAWKPRRSLPVALALAHLQRDGEVSQVQMEKAIREILNGWCESAFQRDSGRLTYPIERVSELVTELRENRILDGWRFRSPLLEAWLQGKILDGYPTDPPTLRALSQGAIPRLRLGALEKVSEGRQAQVFRFTDPEGKRWAVRKSRLDEDTRERFLESLQTLHNLRHENLGREDAAQYIFELRDMGLSDEDDAVAVQIYRWIEGFNLGEKRRKLPVPLVVDIGGKLASAVHLLHSHNILHRDIRPENIILSNDSSRPILIDFGLARSNNRDMATRLHNQEAPYEVQRDKPLWTSAADVFMLASTLGQLADINHPQFRELMTLLGAATVQEHTKRISAEELAEHLKNKSESFSVRERRDQIGDHVEALAARDSRKAWYTRTVRKFKPRFQDLGLGLHEDIFERGCDIADFLNQVLEAYPDIPAERLSLGAVKRPNEAFGDKLVKPEITLLHKLRTYRSHAATRRNDTRQQILRGHDREQIRRQILEGTRALQECLDLSSLLELVRYAIDGASKG